MHVYWVHWVHRNMVQFHMMISMWLKLTHFAHFDPSSRKPNVGHLACSWYLFKIWRTYNIESWNAFCFFLETYRTYLSECQEFTKMVKLRHINLLSGVHKIHKTLYLNLLQGYLKEEILFSLTASAFNHQYWVFKIWRVTLYIPKPRVNIIIFIFGVSTVMIG